MNFHSSTEMAIEAQNQLKKLSSSVFHHAFVKWVEHHQKCVDAKGDYFEKM